LGITLLFRHPHFLSVRDPWTIVCPAWIALRAAYRLSWSSSLLPMLLLLLLFCCFIQSNSQSNKLHSLFTRTQYARQAAPCSRGGCKGGGDCGRASDGAAYSHITELWANTLRCSCSFNAPHSHFHSHTRTPTHIHTYTHIGAPASGSFCGCSTQTTVNDAICFFNAILFEFSVEPNF